MYFLSDFCHLCLKDDKYLIDLSKKVPENNVIGSKLGVCVSEVDWSAPKHLLICRLCLQKLELAYDFKQTCLKSIGTLKKFLTALKINGTANSKSAKLHVPLSNESIDNETLQKYINSQNDPSKYSMLNRILDQPLVYVPTTSLIITNGQQISYQNIFLNFVSANASCPPPTLASQSVGINVNNQKNASENDINIKELLERKNPEEVNVDIDPDFYNFEHFLASTSAPDTTPNIECRTCSKSYTTIKLLRQHFDEVHEGNLPYVCTYCFSKFLFEDHYTKHMKHHMENNADTLVGSTVNLDNLSKVSQARLCGNSIQNEFKCRQCLKICDTPEHFDKHMMNFHDGVKPKSYFVKGMKSVTCSVCNRDFSTESYLEQHMKLHRCKTSKLYKKNVRGKCKISKNVDGDHMKENKTILSSGSKTDLLEEDAEVINVSLANGLDEKSKQVDENFIDSSVTDINDLKIEKENGNENNNLNINNESNDNENAANNSINDSVFNEYIIESADGKPACRFCQRRFGRRHDLKRHINNLHVKSIHYVCHLCGDMFYEGFHLTRHLRSHYTSWSCGECHRMFTNISEVTNHMVTSHESVKSIDCNVCYVALSDMHELKQHMDKHLMEIVYKCHICEESFSECRELTKHVSEHNGVKSCDNCNRMFYSEEEFLMHKETCLEGRYKCDVCPRVFKRKRYLQSHIKARHSAEICVDEPAKKKIKSDEI